MDRFAHEREWVAAGRTVIAGVDEAGRGPLAGPVVAAAVVLPVDWVIHELPEEWSRLNDSKKLTERARERFFALIHETEGIAFSIAEVSAAEIDETDILRATHAAMSRAVQGLPRKPDGILVDGLPVRTLPANQKAIVKGDSLSFSIAAASILAKVTRDRFMIHCEEEYPGYGFAAHKGYGTAAHLRAIEKLGPCAIHRHSFAPIRKDQPELFG